MEENSVPKEFIAYLQVESQLNNSFIDSGLNFSENITPFKSHALWVTRKYKPKEMPEL
jgi:hypothetical protein